MKTVIVLLAMHLTGCIAFIKPLVDAECPLPAQYDSFHNLERVSCASDAQWVKALADDAADEKLDRETRAAYAAQRAAR